MSSLKLEAWQNAVAFTSAPTDLQGHVLSHRTFSRLMYEVVGELEGMKINLLEDLDTWALEQGGWRFVPVNGDGEVCTRERPLAGSVAWWCYPYDTGHIPKETAEELCQQCADAFNQ